ncbi:N-acetylmuramic acid 6-phosphate etherase [Peribacillus frigoritolerans]|uniref:N-acetylmuramic acid 6-phosphate etherase n=1 Tax=Peribacillus frigoritolerans TaxID=450367 RepID=UPI0010598DD3|nr:N-acetylmuramic acid 6-phosphate etherase [Peribacillus frigoritolerans]TDL80312.1 N-acetylmuramic acid 6-phosphate etherase [Peribacillus frigoritolerans]
MEKQLRSLTTELRNEQTMNIDSANTLEILSMMNNEDLKVAIAVQEVLPEIKAAVECAYESLKKGGRLIYIGAGTSGRLGVLDAVECPPTFSTSPDTVIGLIAGGEKAFVRAVEGAEDKEEFGVADLKAIHLSADDTVVGIAASGRTPYVIGALRYAKQTGAKAIALSCNKDAKISEAADIGIEVVVGPEVVTGSTRMKAATAHKMVLNMISTATMIKIGKVYENLMVDVNVSNHKLKERAISIIQTVTDAEYDFAKDTLEKAALKVKPAIVMIKANTSLEEALNLLNRADGDVRKAISLHTS